MSEGVGIVLAVALALLVSLIVHGASILVQRHAPRSAPAIYWLAVLVALAVIVFIAGMISGHGS